MKKIHATNNARDGKSGLTGTIELAKLPPNLHKLNVFGNKLTGKWHMLSLACAACLQPF